ncbi:MAG: ABC transporter permease [Planctomycetota bacterium]
MEPDGRPLTLLGMTWRNLHRQPLRTILTALGVSLGVVAIVSFGAVTRGLWVSTNAAIHFAGGDMMVFQAGAAADIFSTLDEQRMGDALLADPDVAKASATLWHLLPAEPPKMPFAFMIGLRPEPMLENYDRLISGRHPEADDEVLLGRIAARTLEKDVGQTVLLAWKPFKIVGIFETDIVYFDAAIVMTMDRLQKLSGKAGQTTAFQVALRPGADLEVVAHRLEKTIPGIAAVTSAKSYKKVDQGLEMISAANRTVSLMAIIIGSVIVTNTMWMAVHERTREIGVLRAIGWSKRRVVSMIIIESCGIGLLACPVGCLLGVGLAKMSTVMPVSSQFLDPVFDWRPFVTAMVVAVMLSVLGGALPAWRAARVSPVEALRHE